MNLKSVSRSLFATELVSPRTFIQSWDVDVHRATLLAPSNEEETLNNIAARMNVSDETVKELAEVCGKNTLRSGIEPKSKLHLLQMKEVPPDVDLECVKHQMKNLQQRQNSDSFRMHMIRHLKYKGLDDYMVFLGPSSSAKIDPEFQVQRPTVVLTVQITKCLLHGDSQTAVREKETFLVLASQTLADLRDKIKCSSDNVIPGDYSCMPDVDPESLQKSGDIFKSSLFFIENVFYNDSRLPDNKDYSKPIIEWGKDISPNWEVSTADMAQTKFEDLSFKLGENYLFMHQANCEHAVIFTDMRLFTANDNQDIRAYPLSYVKRMKKRTVCQGCLKFTARWTVRDSPLIPTDPCLLCRVCFKTLMYTKQGKKTSNFKAQPFVDCYT